MKIRLFPLIIVIILISTSAYSQFSCPNGVRFIFNELEYDIDTETNVITFNLECDPCAFEDDGSNCGCRKDCVEAGYTEEDYIEYEKCIEECRDLYISNSTDEDYCLDACEAGLYSTERNCLEDCGTFVPNTKVAETYGVFYQLWWTNGISESMDGNPDEEFIDTFEGQPNKFVHLSTQDFMDESISFCINYQIVVQYNDGTCCIFVGRECIQKG